MNKEELLQKLAEIEWDDFECKAAQDKLPDDVWATCRLSQTLLAAGLSLVSSSRESGLRYRE